MKNILAGLLLLCIAPTVFANVRLPKIFGNNMVLQRGQPIPVWGWADKNEKITVRLNTQVKNVKTDANGKWRVDLSAMEAGGPYELNVNGKNSIRFTNVLIGDVWVCSGQSNMEWTLNNTDGAAKEIATANFPQLRHFTVTKAVASEVQDDVKGGEWDICTPTTAANFTAVGYYFAKELMRELKVPIGLLNTSWGGTHVETWTSRDAFEHSDEFKSMIAQMPTLNLDSLSRQKNAAAEKRIAALQGKFQNGKMDVGAWKDASFNDAAWPKMKVPGEWEGQELGDVDGIVWLRKTIELTTEQAGKEAVLELAMIDDADETFINGVKVGTTNGYNEKRHYKIPAGTLKPGKNSIAIRVNDTGGGGGIHGEPADVKLTVGNNPLPLDGIWQYQVESVLGGSTGVGPNSYPTLLYNAMLHPLVPFAIKGAIWYQGESNAGRAVQYGRAFPLMITDWRKQWKQGDFPFYFVQLATFNAGNGNSERGSSWAELREAQTATLKLPNTGMAVTTDIGDPKDIHPRNKLDVGKRLAAVALNKTYGKGNVFSGPTFTSMKTEGNKIILSFDHLGGGLSTQNKYGYLQGFEISGTDKRFYPARAFIEGDKVVVFQEGVASPVAVRFGWADDAGENNLFNKEGFPAVPFRTDSWPLSTEKNVYQVGN
ncbi:MAG: sialate O-acetylesterase [Bacteroidota bacterium]